MFCCFEQGGRWKGLVSRRAELPVRFPRMLEGADKLVDVLSHAMSDRKEAWDRRACAALGHGIEGARQ